MFAVVEIPVIPPLACGSAGSAPTGTTLAARGGGGGGGEGLGGRLKASVSAAGVEAIIGAVRKPVLHEESGGSDGLLTASELDQGLGLRSLSVGGKSHAGRGGSSSTLENSDELSSSSSSTSASEAEEGGRAEQQVEPMGPLARALQVG